MEKSCIGHGPESRGHDTVKLQGAIFLNFSSESAAMQALRGRWHLSTTEQWPQPTRRMLQMMVRSMSTSWPLRWRLRMNPYHVNGQ